MPARAAAHYADRAVTEPESTTGALEDEIRTYASENRWADAATTAILGYGPELLGYLGALADSRPQAEELFAEVCERMWRNLPRFAWRSSFRTWAYAIARHAAADRRRADTRRARREMTLSEAPPDAVVTAMRSTIERSRELDHKRLDEVRELLEEDDRTLLVLRVERGMAWLDIAQVIDGSEDSDAPVDLERSAARLRKQFERVKQKLRTAITSGREQS